MGHLVLGVVDDLRAVLVPPDLGPRIGAERAAQRAVVVLDDSSRPQRLRELGLGPLVEVTELGSLVPAPCASA